jgi:hypothetical protein
MTYPAFFYTDKKIPFMSLPMAYQEFLVRWYYYNNTEETQIPDTIPIENIEEAIAEHLNPANMWSANGFAAARNVTNGDNLDFKNDSEFHGFCVYVAQVYYDFAVKNNWIKADISKKDFLESCQALKGTYKIHI